MPDPSCPQDLSPTGWSVFIAEIIRKVVSLPPVCHPLVSPDHGPPKCIQLMKQCWEEAPEDRPNLDQIYSQVSATRGAGCSQETVNQFTSLCPVGAPLSQGPGNPMHRGGNRPASSPLRVEPEVYHMRESFSKLRVHRHCIPECQAPC